MKRFISQLVFLLLFNGAAFSQNIGKIAGWQKELLSKNISDTAKITLYINIASEYGGSRNDSALNYANKAEIMAFKSSSTQQLARALYTKAKPLRSTN